MIGQPSPRPELSVQEEADARRLASLRAALHPIIRYLEDDSIREVILNADGWIWIDQVGRGMRRTETRMVPEDTLRMLRLVTAAVGGELNYEHATLAAKLPHWGARLQAWIPPVSIAPAFNLRKPPKIVFTLEDYVRKTILTERQALALHDAVLQSKNIIVGGGTGSGKTTLLNALLAVVASETNDRIYLIEDNPEIQCASANKLEILTHPPRYTTNTAVQDALRARPDRIIIGEVRDGAAHEMIKSWGTGHSGMCSVHSNSCAGNLDRICHLIEEVIHPAPKDIVAETVDICLHLRHDRSHPAERSITGIMRCVGWEQDAGWRLEPLV